jgi:hypothetical protein
LKVVDSPNGHNIRLVPMIAPHIKGQADLAVGSPVTQGDKIAVKAG